MDLIVGVKEKTLPGPNRTHWDQIAICDLSDILWLTISALELVMIPSMHGNAVGLYNVYM